MGGCYLGCNLSGLYDFSEAGERGFQSGIELLNSNGNRIDGTRVGTGNLISGNVGVGGRIEGGRSNLVAGNLIGTDATETMGVANRFSGVWLTKGTSRNLVGGDDPGARNLISGNSTGVTIESSSENRVAGNVIGPNRSGTAPLETKTEEEQFNGVGIPAGINNEILRNVLSANSGCGVTIYGGSRNLVSENWVGVDVSGTNALGNGLSGVCLGPEADRGEKATANGISNNVLGANGPDGILLSYSGSRQNTVVGNFISTDRSGTVNLGHARYGVALLQGASQNVIGEVAAGGGKRHRLQHAGWRAGGHQHQHAQPHPGQRDFREPRPRQRARG